MISDANCPIAVTSAEIIRKLFDKYQKRKMRIDFFSKMRIEFFFVNRFWNNLFCFLFA